VALFSGFLIGFLGSIHCIGMCGPIALTLPASTRYQFVAGRALYNLGRVVTYSGMGAVAGFFGRGLHLAGLQQTASIVIGVLLVLTVLFPRVAALAAGWWPFAATLSRALQQVFQHLRSRASLFALFLIGIANGFLPCGFVLVGLGGALSLSDSLGGAMFMAGFGAGTMPAMMLVSFFGRSLPAGIRQRLRVGAPVLTIVLALLFIVRGLGLGIPYVSPAFPSVEQRVDSVRCH
jgi:sulfite exporter TauE/SafE